ncbi:MAG: RiPP maturation radical SAM C-methyltransferase [Candidatus Eremiobacterota bacterium]
MDFSFVNMPYGSPVTTSIGTGLLKAILKGHGIKSSVIYANLLFLEETGLEIYKIITELQSRLFGDWIFASMIPAENRGDAEEYIRLITDHDMKRFPVRNREYVRELLLNMRKKAEVFVDTLIDDIVARKTRIVGVSVNYLQLIPSLALLNRLREKAPDIITVMGGPSCETTMGLTLHKNFPFIDYTVSGEADELIYSLTCSVMEHGRDIEPAKLPEGVLAPFHRKTGYPDTIKTVSVSPDGLPLPDCSDYFDTLNKLPLLREKLVPAISVESSRGCWWAQQKPCNFCGLNGTRREYRTKPWEKTLMELDSLYERYGVNRFNITDTMMNMSYIKTLMPELIRRKSPYIFIYEITSRLKKSDVKTLREAGAVWLQPGIESLHSDILSAFNKGTQAWQNIQTLKWCHQYGIKAIWNILYDFPGEKDEWYKEMSELMPLLFHLQPPRLFKSVFITRDSDYFVHAGEYGICLRPRSSEFYRYVLPLPEKTLYDLSCFFESESGEEDDTFSYLLHVWRNKAKEETIKWNNIFNSDRRPLLHMTVSEDALHITDTRPVAKSSSFTLRGIEKDIYLYCDDAPLKENLFKDFSEYGVDKIKEIVEYFIASKLAVFIDSRIVSLALSYPYRELPGESQIPWGYIKS